MRFRATKGKFLVTGYDSFSNEDWEYEEKASLAEAKKFAEDTVRGKNMLKVYVFDDAGKKVYSTGTF